MVESLSTCVIIIHLFSMIEGMHFASPHHLPSFAQVQWSRLSCWCSQGLKDRGEQQRSDWLVDWCCIYTCYTSCDGIQSEMPRSPTCVSTQVPLVGHSSDSLSHLQSHQPLVESHHGIINSIETAFVETLPGNMLVTLGGGDHTLMQCLWWSSEDVIAFCSFCHLLPFLPFCHGFLMISTAVFWWDPSRLRWRLEPAAIPLLRGGGTVPPKRDLHLGSTNRSSDPLKSFSGCECWKVPV